MRVVGSLLLLSVVLCVLAGCDDGGGGAQSGAGATGPPPPPAEQEKLFKKPVKGKQVPKTGAFHSEPDGGDGVESWTRSVLMS